MSTRSDRLEPGGWGKITVRAEGDQYVARVTYRDLAGTKRQARATGRSERAARQALTKKLRGKLKVADGLTLKTTTPLRDLAALWLAQVDKSDRAASTRRRYREIVELHVLPGLGDLTIAECLHSRLQRFLDTVAENIGPATAKHCKSVLAGMMKVALKDGVLDHGNPARDLTVASPPRSTVSALAPAEVRGFLSLLRAHEDGKRAQYVKDKRPDLARRLEVAGLADLADFLAATGARISEALAVRWSDLDLDPDDGPATVTIGRSVERVTGQGMVVRPHRKNHPEGESLVATLPSWAVQSLKNRRELHIENGAIENPGGLVFPSSRNGVRDDDNARKQLRAARADMGVEETVTPHTFRRSLASAIADQLGDEAAARQLDDDIGTARRHYIKRTHRADYGEAIELFDPGKAS